MAKPALNQEIGVEIDALIESGHVRPLIGARFPLERGSEALELIDGRGATGKVVLDVKG
jgi:NADPH2:quinone reductase